MMDAMLILEIFQNIKQVFIDLIDLSNLTFVFTKTITSGSFDGIK